MSALLPSLTSSQDTGAAQVQHYLKIALLSLPFVFLIAFFFLPMCWLVITSLSTHEIGAPPRFTGTLENYARYWTDPFYLETSLWTTVRLSVVATFLTVIIGYVLAYFIAELPPNRQSWLIILVVVSMSVNIVIRIFGLNVLLMNNGLVNAAVTALGLPRLRIMYTELGVLVGLVQIAVPYIVLPLIGVLSAIDPAMREAAASVGANRLRTFWAVTFPLSIPGVIAGSIIVLTLNLAAFAIPRMMGGGRVRMMGMLAYQEASIQGNFPFAAAVGISLAVLTLAISLIYLSVVNRWFKGMTR